MIHLNAQGKLLIVDDELSVRDSLAKWFHEEGYDVGTAESASDALTRLAEHSWDAALLDIKMRGTDGIELLGAHPRDRSQPGRHHDDRVRLGRNRRRRTEEWRLRLRHQAARSR